MKKAIIYLLIVFTVSCNTNNSNSTDLDNPIKKIDTYLNEMNKNNEYSGSLLIARNDTVLLKKAFGYANIGFNNLNHIDTKYRIASMCKMFTAVAIIQLKEKGVLNLSDTIGKILKDYPNIEVKNKVTIHQLLSHTSGMGDYFNETYENSNQSKIRTLKDYLPFFQDDKLEFEPGTDNSYSNAGYVVLGLIIEKLTNESYYEYVENNIFKKADMQNTGFKTDIVVNKLAEGYEFSYVDSAWRKTDISGAIASSAGGAFSTVEDLYKFAIALKNNILISKTSLDLMITDHSNHNYGYGFSIKDVNGITGFGHNGGAPGSSGELDIFKNGYIIISLSNRSPYDGWAEIRTIMRKEILGNTPYATRFLDSKKIIKTYKNKGFKDALLFSENCESGISESLILYEVDKYIEQKKYNKAIELTDIVINTKPKSWFPISKLADIYFEIGNNKKASENYKKSIDLNPNNEHAISQLNILKINLHNTILQSNY